MSNGESVQTSEANEKAGEETTPTISFTKTESQAEGQAEGQAADEGSKTEATQYEAFNLPDDWEIADDDLAAFSDVARDMELDQAGAQKLVDLFIAVRQGQMTADEANVEQVDGPEEWQAQLHADEKLGGDNLEKTQANINMLVKTMPEETWAYFQESSAHLRPEIIPWLNKLGSMLQEDSVNIGGDGDGGDGKTPAQRMFSKSGHV